MATKQVIKEVHSPEVTNKLDSADGKENENQSEEGINNPLHDGTILKKGKAIVTNLPNQEGSSSQIETSLEGWKYPKIPVDEIYGDTYTSLDLNKLFGYKSFWSQAKTKLSKLLPNNPIQDIEKTITITANERNISIALLENLPKIKNNNNFMHLGLIQVEIKPLLLSDGSEAPIKVGIRQPNLLDFDNSFIALVETDLCQGPFYFNCFPGYSVVMEEMSDVLKLHVTTKGMPLALTYRVVGKTASFPLIVPRCEESDTRETCYFHPKIGSVSVTRWEDVQVPESWKVM